MNRKVMERLIATLITMLLVSSFVFLLQDFTLGDSSAVIFAEDADESLLSSYREINGLNDNIFIRYLRFLSSFFTFNWGTTVSGMDIKSVLSERFLVTITIALFSLVLSLLISTPWTLSAVINKGSLADKAHSVYTTITLSLPSFLIALFLSLVFALGLRWFPVAGFIPLKRGVLGYFRSLFLPSLTLAILHSSLFMRVLKASLEDNLEMPYSIALKAQGADRKDLVLHSALKISLPVMVSLVSESLASSFAGAAIVENVFALPGIGSLFVSAALARDVHLSAILIMLISFIVSVLYFLSFVVSSLVDPRLKESER